MTRVARFVLAAGCALSLGIVVLPAGIQGSGRPVAGIQGSGKAIVALAPGGVPLGHAADPASCWHCHES
jgi:hypothetical protein